MIEVLTVKQCEDLQIRKANAYGDKWPFKGHYSTGYLHENPPIPDLPVGWQWIQIFTWGLHVRRDNDLDYMNDLLN